MSIRRPHDVSPFLQALRNLLLGREHAGFLRFAKYISPRTQAIPDIPGGCSSKINNNYYYTRDGRRLVEPVEVILENKASGQTVLFAPKPASKSDGAVVATEKKARTPGAMYLPPTTM